MHTRERTSVSGGVKITTISWKRTLLLAALVLVTSLIAAYLMSGPKTAQPQPNPSPTTSSCTSLSAACLE